MISNSDATLVQIIKREKSKLSGLGIEDPQFISFGVLSSLKKELMKPINSEEFSSILSYAQQESIEVYCKLM